MNAWRFGAAERVLREIELVDRRRAEETVGESGRVAHQLADRRRVCRLLQNRFA
jgi:hypothetical protein